MFFKAEMAFSQLTSTAVQLYDDLMNDAGKMTNDTLNNVLEATYYTKFKSADVLLANSHNISSCNDIHMMIFLCLCDATKYRFCVVLNTYWATHYKYCYEKNHSFMLFCQLDIFLTEFSIFWEVYMV